MYVNLCLLHSIISPSEAGSRFVFFTMEPLALKGNFGTENVKICSENI